MHIFLEQTGEIEHIIYPYGETYLVYFHVGCVKQCAGFHDFEHIKVAHGAVSCGTLEYGHEMRL